jgi:hypothetical protein
MAIRHSDHPQSPRNEERNARNGENDFNASPAQGMKIEAMLPSDPTKDYQSRGNRQYNVDTFPDCHLNRAVFSREVFP